MRSRNCRGEAETRKLPSGCCGRVEEAGQISERHCQALRAHDAGRCGVVAGEKQRRKNGWMEKAGKRRAVPALSGRRVIARRAFVRSERRRQRLAGAISE